MTLFSYCTIRVSHLLWLRNKSSFIQNLSTTHIVDFLFGSGSSRSWVRFELFVRFTSLSRCCYCCSACGAVILTFRPRASKPPLPRWPGHDDAAAWCPKTLYQSD